MYKKEFVSCDVPTTVALSAAPPAIVVAPPWRTCRQWIVSRAAMSLCVLVFQNASVVLMTRYSRFSRPPSRWYHTSSLVLNQEIVKMALCIAIFCYETPPAPDPAKPEMSSLSVAVWRRETLILLLPAALFTMQNYLNIVALSHLDAMTFQVLSQTKLLSAAVFSVWLLDKRLNAMQWISLTILSSGVLLAQYEGPQSSSLPRPTKDVNAAHQNTLLGVVTCVVSGLSSSFAGVYFEKVVKTTPPSLAIRNIQLSLFGIPLALASLLAMDAVPSWGHFDFWRGYDAFIVALVMVHALGGLLVAIVVKYADNILKGFATGIAIVVSGLFTAFFWAYEPSPMWVLGCCLVALSPIMYQLGGDKPDKPSKESQPQAGSPVVAQGSKA